MSLKTRNKRTGEFSMASMSDLVFLLLIFFMLTSTLVSPNAVKLFLPSSSSKTLAKQNITIYINSDLQYSVDNDVALDENQFLPVLSSKLNGLHEETLVLRADKTVPVQNIVTVIDAINNINNANNAKHKLILATSPK